VVNFVCYLFNNVISSFMYIVLNDNELERIQKEVIMASVKVLLQHLSGGT
jgi:hypothetical protein